MSPISGFLFFFAQHIDTINLVDSSPGYIGWLYMQNLQCGQHNLILVPVYSEKNTFLQIFSGIKCLFLKKGIFFFWPFFSFFLIFYQICTFFFYPGPCSRLRNKKNKILKLKILKIPRFFHLFAPISAKIRTQKPHNFFLAQ